jgi:cytochrome c556
MAQVTNLFVLSILLVFALPAVAGDSPQEQRHELMEHNGDAAKAVGGMLKKERPFDAAVAMDSFKTWAESIAEFGDLFPAGTETGYDTKARSTIWSDRAGFDAALQDFADAVDQAIAAEPQDLESLNAAAGPVFKKCKSCHEDYRLEDN